MSHSIDVDYLNRLYEWNVETFGPGPRTEGITDHIRKELKEILADSSDCFEWVDVIILALSGACRCLASQGEGDFQKVVDMIFQKQLINELRDWPDWRESDPTKAITHVK